MAAEVLGTAHWVGALIRGSEGSLCSYKNVYDGHSRRGLGRNGAKMWQTVFYRGFSEGTRREAAFACE